MCKKSMSYAAAFAAAMVFPFATQAVTLPVPVHAGALEKLERVTEAQVFVDISEALAKNERKPVDLTPDWLRLSTPPANGMVYVLLTLKVQDKRSISVADYVLVADGVECKCKGLAMENNIVFDPRRIKATGPATVKMLFECPEKAEAATLQPRPGFPLAEIKDLVLIEKAPEPQTAAPEPAAKTEPAAAAAPAEQTATDDVPATTKPAGQKPQPPTAAQSKNAPDKPAPKQPAPKPAAEQPKPAPKPAAEQPKPAPKPAAEDNWF